MSTDPLLLTLCALEKKQSALKELNNNLLKCKSAEEKLQLLRSLRQSPIPNTESLDSHLQVIVESLYAIGQGDRLFSGLHSFSEAKSFLKTLIPVEEFYKELGGLVGYHLKFLDLLIDKEMYCRIPPKGYERPPGIDLTKDSAEVKFYIRRGIESLTEIAEIYPIAGAADRLDLKDPLTEEPLPAAQLEFLGITLLESLIRDVIGREYLCYKLTGQSVTIPILLMTSHEKNNETHVRAILDSHGWYGRPKDSFFFIHQPLMPVIRHDAEWASKGPLHLAMKPGGHGALWKLLQAQGGFEWLKNSKHSKIIIRQINNPIAGVDNGLLALSGIGYDGNKAFGFASCERYLNSEEGMDILIERKTTEGYAYAITNIEYTDFEQQGIQDVPDEPSSPFSHFPANSNILFADLKIIEKTIQAHPFPGLMINLKSKTPCHANGELVMIPAGRLESTMQNIADYLVTSSAHPLSSLEKQKLSTFVTYNRRRKTIAATKRAYNGEGKLRDTPEGTFLEVMQNSKELLEKCGFISPEIPFDDAYLQKGPSFIFTYHPALGPLYQVISQKIKTGVIQEKSELKLEITEILVENLNLKGSLLITADDLPMGKCILRNVTVENLGMDRSKPSIYWKYQINRLESVNIKIEGNGEFIAENITFKGNYNIVVPANQRCVAKQKGESVEYIFEPIIQPTWEWKYQFNTTHDIVLHFDIYKGRK